MAEVVNENRPKRIRTTLSRLKRRNRKLRAHLAQYRRWTLASGGAALCVMAVLGFVVVSQEPPEPVLLGRGEAGVRADSVAASDSLTLADSLSAPEGAGSEAGSGEASYYGNELAGRPTASGEPFDPEGLTAAHRTLPLGSRVRVTNVRNGKSVVVRINDRGPFTGSRVIDVSRGAASRLGMLGAGTALVRLHLLDR